jgi:hypothetical protein
VRKVREVEVAIPAESVTVRVRRKAMRPESAGWGMRKRPEVASLSCRTKGRWCVILDYCQCWIS